MEKINFIDAFETDSCIIICAEISKEEVLKLFNEAGQIPKNSNMEPDNSFVSGEVQYVIDKDQSSPDDLKISEITIWPVYANDEDRSLENGDFINAGDSWWKYCGDAIKFWNEM